MLINFKVSNSRSIAEEMDISFISVNDVDATDSFTVPLSNFDFSLLKTTAFMGANASGKSNILKAIQDANRLILGKLPLEDCFNHTKNLEHIYDNKPISYSFDILLDGYRYNYMFSHNAEYIMEEKLFLWKNNKDYELIFSRERIKDKFQWLPKSFFKQKDADYFYKSTPNNKLFLTVTNGDVNSEAVNKILVLENVYSWFEKQLVINASIFTPGKMYYDDFITYILKSDENKAFFLKLIEIADIPIKNISVIELVEVSADSPRYTYTKPNGNDVSIQIKTIHSLQDNAAQFDFFREESHGTQQFLAWLGSWLLKLQEDEKPTIFIIDELGSNLHPLLTQLLVKIFYAKKINKNNSQLIFTTHEVKLMDKNVMRPEQLYLVNKVNQISSIIRLSSFEDIESYSRFDELYMYNGLSGTPAFSKNLIIDNILD